MHLLLRGSRLLVASSATVKQWEENPSFPPNLAEIFFKATVPRPFPPQRTENSTNPLLVYRKPLRLHASHLSKWVPTHLGVPPIVPPCLNQPRVHLLDLAPLHMLLLNQDLNLRQVLRRSVAEVCSLLSLCLNSFKRIAMKCRVCIQYKDT